MKTIRVDRRGGGGLNLILWIAHNSKKVRLHPSSDVEKYMKNLEKETFEVEHRPRLLM